MTTPTAELLVAETHRSCRVLGPGDRYGLWVQGCPLRCAGCVSPQWLPSTGGERVAVDALAREILEFAVDGLTVSGGEPFAQAAGLVALIHQIRDDRDLSVCCYTGYTLEGLRRGDPAQRELLGLVDLLIDGPYVSSRHAPLRWRASTNQRLHVLSDRHLDVLAEPDDPAGLQIEIGPGGDVQWLGVPHTPGFREALAGAAGLVEARDRR
ncbi:4Fe-4S single cluster domain-containing protein [Pseudonocardia yuanmonensis]|uniref:4Fe-4S single cluster domain-containing protein n=1 Tax=Pseudonocardia yuanmonensis TaxID=1095914 RepID=A0ABP8VYF1_9PSEU